MNLQDALDQIDLYDDRLIPNEIISLSLAKDRVQRYIHDGHHREARGGLRILQIMWQGLTGDEPIDTGWGSL